MANKQVQQPTEQDTPVRSRRKAPTRRSTRTAPEPTDPASAGSGPAEDQPTSGEQTPAEPGEALAGVVAKLRDELTGMRRAMRNRAVIEQAKGVLVERLGISPEDAFDQLVRLSQRTNIKLAEVAAALVGATAPTPDSDRPGELLDDELRQYLAGARRPTTATPGQSARHGTARSTQIETLQAQHRLLAARITTAQDYPQIAESIAESHTGWPRPDAVRILLRDPSDELRTVGGHGAEGESEDVLHRLARSAVTDRAPVWTEDSGDARIRSVLATPLSAGNEPVGALVVGWSAGAAPDPDARRYLAALAEPIGRRIGQLTPAEATADTNDPVRVVLDTVPEPAALLTAIRDSDGRVTDFGYAYTNAAATAELTGLAGPDATDRTLLAVLPDTGSRLLLPVFAGVLADGVPCSLGEVNVDAAADATEHSMVARVHAARIGELVLVVWRARSDADLLHDQLLQAERIGRLGSFWWNLRTGETRWSPELYRLLSRTVEQGALALSDGEQYVHPDDWYAVQEAIRGALLGGRSFTVEHRLADAPGRRLRVSGEPEFDSDGAVCAIRGTVQDVTAERAIESRLRHAQEALAAQRQRLHAESQAAETLQQALLPTDPELTTTPGISVRGLCRLAESTGRVAGDWYDVFAVPESGTYLVVGDVTGTGLSATVAAARLRNAVRAYAALRMTPGELLTALNRMIGDLGGSQLATLVVARFSATGRQLRWAAAGQAAPVRYAPDGRAAVLTGPLGLPVGAAPDVVYEETSVDLHAGERLLLYTDGLVVRRDRSLASGLEVLLHAAGHVDLSDPAALVGHVTATLDSAPDDDLCVVLTEVTS